MTPWLSIQTLFWKYKN